MKLIPIGSEVKITYLRDGKTNTTHAKAMRNPEKGIISQPIIEARKYLDVFGMIIQQLSFEIIEAMHEIDPNARIDMLQVIDQDKPVLVVTNIQQGTKADDQDWPVGEMIIRVNQQDVHTLDDLEAIINSSRELLFECRNGRIGYFTKD